MKSEADLFLEEMTEKKHNFITENEFEKLPKEEQNFRWALFLKSNGYEKELSSEVIQELREKYLIKKQKLDKNLFRG